MASLDKLEYRKGVQRNRPWSVRSPTQPALHEKATPINRYSPDKLDCQSGLPVDPTAPIRISLGSSIGPTVTVGINRFSCRPLVRSDPTLGSLSPRCLNLFIGYSKHTVSRSGILAQITEHKVQHLLTRRACATPSAEWDLTSSHHYAPSIAYVEGGLYRMRESWLDIIRKLDRSNGYKENQSILLSPVGSIGPDSRLFEPALL
ncbi:hypothetical protein CRG98_038901 [Punica granatum]|uniref:Uncharacterized protein n=1 Tax=Punica granatum TaxID=22663 RepID=A0A2I0IAN2_PUNGR|nr:hypothetical protein CRG98_038901 [Punica granatum]